MIIIFGEALLAIDIQERDDFDWRLKMLILCAKEDCAIILLYSSMFSIALYQDPFLPVS
jgi:hypothetical protein